MSESYLVRYITSENLSDINKFLFINRFHIFEIGGKNITDTKSFFKNVMTILPFDPPLSGNVHWDAFTDSLWYGIDNLKERHVAIIWNNSDFMMKRDPENFKIAVECFEDVAQGLWQDSMTELLIFISCSADDLNLSSR